MSTVPDRPPPPADPAGDRRAENNERFIAFAFAAADMLVESDASGTITFAAGAFQSKFGRPPAAFIGHSIRALVAAVDHEALISALWLLAERGRLLPLMIRLSDRARTPLALAGMTLPGQGRPRRLCLSFAQPPVQQVDAPRAAVSPRALARATEAQLRTGTPSDLGLLEIFRQGSVVNASDEAIGREFESAAPASLACEIGPGRYGLLGAGGTEADLLAVGKLLAAGLRKQGVEVSVSARYLSLATKDLNPTQTVRALRQALNVFARDGVGGLGKAGFGGGLAGYIRRAASQAGSLCQAIRNAQFTLAFQPVVSLADRTTHHFEALVRPHPVPDFSFTGPQEFVMLVEALGLAGEFDLAVARLSCEAAFKAGTRVAFNVSGQSVQSRAFRDKLVALLEASPARKSGLVRVEMTEAAEIEDVAEARLTADALRSLGIPFCLDDFAAGAANVQLLRALTPEAIKLDGSYSAGVVQGGRERAFVAAMVEIATAAGAGIVAEWIETEAQAEAARALGVQYGQGWLFGRPGPQPSGRAESSATGHRAAARPGGGREIWR